MNNKFSLKILSILALSLVLGVGQVFTQSTVTGGINGKVIDPQGAVIPNATVTVTNNGTNASQNTTATGDGTFRIANLQPGIYTLEVSSQGFSNFKRENVAVEVGRLTTINASMGVSGVDVEVTVDAPVINTSNQDFANNIGETSISELPINGRRASNFVLLTPGVAPDGDFGLISFRGISGLLKQQYC